MKDGERYLINDFSGLIKAGEMLLVLGRFVKATLYALYQNLRISLGPDRVALLYGLFNLFILYRCINLSLLVSQNTRGSDKRLRRC